MNIKRTVISLIYLWLIFVGTVLPQSVEWRGLTLLRSTRSDVEKVLGAPYKKELNLYDTEKERVVVWYSKGNCKENKSSVWNVPKDTVLRILVSPKEKFGVSEITDSSPQTFERIEDVKVRGVVNYFSNDGSIEFETRLSPDGFEDVEFIAYAPSGKDKHLRCKSTE